MEHGEQVRLLKELRRQLDAGVNVDAGVMLKNPANAYTCPDMAGKEWDAFFRNHAQIIGLSGDLPEPNSFVTLDDFGVAILATRDQDGNFRAFLNSCRHRGSMVETAPKGKKRAFSCPFHGWTYSSAGDLVGIPEPDHFGEIDTSCHGLIELPAVEKYGLLIVHPKPDQEIDADKLLGGLAPEFQSWDWGSLINAGATTYDMKLNWKLAIDTFGETYHFKRLHANTLGQNFYGDVQCYDRFERNHRMILCIKTIDDLGALPEEDWRMGVGGLPVYYLFPNVQIIAGAGGVTLVRVYPDPEDPNRSISQITFYYTEEAAASDDNSIEARFQGFASIIEAEDYATCVTTQKALASGIQDYVIFGRNEPALHHYHNTYRKVLGMDPLEEFGPS